jgi:hypothetical protein
VYRLRYREERRRKTRVIYERKVCLISSAYGQLVSGLYIHATVVPNQSYGSAYVTSVRISFDKVTGAL